METLKKYSWILPLLNKLPKLKRKIFKNFRKAKINFYPQGEYKADIKNLINCMLCPNMCRFDCGALQAAQIETMSPGFKAKIGYYLSMGKIDFNDSEFVNLMYKCTNEENCKVWCPFDFSVVSLLETVRDDINDKGFMPDFCKEQIEKLKKTNTIEDYNIFETYMMRGIDNIETDGNDDVFYYIGCEAMKFPDIVKANIEILKRAGIKFSTNLAKRSCCGAPAFNIREFNIAKDLANKNKELIESTGAKIIVSECPGCVVTLTKRYEKVDINIDAKIIHIVEYIKQLVEDGKIKLEKPISDEFKRITIHDPCLLARNLNDTTSIRDLLGKIQGIELNEPLYKKEETHCCGWSGTLHWADKELAIKEATNRINELKETGANIIISSCPLCELGLTYGLAENEKDKIKIEDISVLILRSIK